MKSKKGTPKAAKVRPKVQGIVFSGNGTMDVLLEMIHAMGEGADLKPEMCAVLAVYRQPDSKGRLF